MEFGILGPLQITRNGAPVPLPGRVLPRLVAVLLLDANHVVPPPKLIEAMWEDRPPATTRRQIQNKVADARSLLLDHDIAGIETVGEGYRLQIRTEQLDSLRFQSGVRIAREQVDASEPEAALESLRQALALWRGPTLTDLTGRVIEAEAALWNEERAAAEEDRAELALTLNTGEALIGDLRRVLEQHPYRQRTAELLMTALYRDDRIPEALDTFETMRARLSDELGIDPRKNLRDLHTAILRNDPTLNGPKETPEVPPPDDTLPPPAQLPADSVHFTGRRPQLQTLDRLLQPGPNIAVLSGIGGTGKTALALHWAHRTRDRFDHGQLYVNLRGFDRAPPLTPLDALAGFLRALRVPSETIPSDTDEAATLLRTRLADTRTLLVLDNAHSAQQVKPLLPATSECATVITSRYRLAELAALYDVIQISVPSLEPDDSIRLLTNIAGTARLAAEPQAARHIAKACAGLPLALRIVGTNLTGQPDRTLADTATELTDHDRLPQLAVEGDPTTTVAAAFDLSFQTLGPDEEQLYLKLACLPGADISKGLATALADGPPATTERILSRLVTANRIEEYRPGRYRFHDLVGEYARRKAEEAFNPPELQQLREQVVHWYTHGDTTRLPVNEYRNIISTFLDWNGHPTASRLLTRLVAFADAGYREEPSDTLYEMPELAFVAERAIETGQRSDDPMDAVRAYALADAVAYASGDLDRSMRYAHKRLAALRRTPHGDATGKARGDLGTTMTQAGRYREAVSLLREAVAAAERSGRRQVQVEVLTSLGSVLRRMGIYAESETLLLRARDIDASLEGGPTSVYPLLSLTELYIDTQRVTAAEELCQTISEMLRDHPSKYFHARLYFRQAAVHRADHDHVRAEAALTRGLELVEEVNSWRHQLVYTYRLAELLVDTGQVDRAREALDRVDGLDRYQTSETLAVRARVLCKLHARTGDLHRSIKLGRQAADVFAAMPDPLRQARSLVALARAYERADHAEAAADCRAEAHDLFTRLGIDPHRGAAAPVA
ncbi:AfsR/SARP family transcriptional regulator [Glycomyces xiaoerkulensis]|uniref:AfsR/SARP family transcriptional regulator n=1 Tax=Glycomyces xiaoerkulensis TaxID=2038139 RepID=UPI000C262261|nr:BTAD domain-containing putative transcriptional regulator [Glycomyces xiaoerkulensis]